MTSRLMLITTEESTFMKQEQWAIEKILNI